VDRQAWNRRYAGSELLWTARPSRYLEAEVAPLPPARALDMACGEGRNAVWLAERGWQVTGVDFSDVALAKARRLAGERGVSVAWVCADVRRFVPPSRAFDLVAVLYLHLPAPERRDVLARAADALAPGGVLLVLGHDASNPEEGYGGPQDPAILFTPEEIASELSGLVVERAERVRRPIPSVEGDVHAIDAIVRATREANLPPV
jgi:SAM-dependent methyltransferase